MISEEARLKISKAHIKISSKQEKIIVIYYTSGLLAREIKAKLNIGIDTIYGCLKRNNVNLRPSGHQKGRPSFKKGIKLSKKQKEKLNMEGLELGRAWNRGKTGCYSEEVLEKMRIRMLGKTGEEAINWQGGKSFEPYAPEFNYQLKNKIRERDNYCCQLCEIKENGKSHDCHHINYNKKNNEENNLILLCMNCHMRTNGNREYWSSYFKDFLLNQRKTGGELGILCRSN